MNRLLASYINAVPSIISVAIVDRDGLIITSRGATRDDTIIGGISASLDTYVARVKKEYGGEESFFSLQVIGNRKFAFFCEGSTIMVTTIAEASTPDIVLRVYSEHVAKTAHLILKGEEHVSIDIPVIVKLLSKTRQGTLPTGMFSRKVVICGDYAVGKTSLIRKFVENRFQKIYLPTIGVEISTKTIELGENTSIKLVIWDIGGQKEAFMRARARYYEGAHCLIIVIDRTREGTLNNIEDWVADVAKSVKMEHPVLIIANKSDLVHNITISEEDIKKVAARLDCQYILTSAKTGQNVDDSFRYIAHEIIQGSF